MRRCAVIALVLLLAGGAGLFFGGGFHEINAIRQHPAWVYFGLATVRDTLVSLKSGDVEIPPGFQPLADPAGVALYQKHCVQCHGAPGLPREEFALGLMPVAPSLVQSARERPPEQIYWFIREGLKMTGMPAWRGRMSEPDMWRITALVEALPGLTPRDYARLLEGAGGPIDAVDPLPPPGIPPSVELADPERGRVAMQLHACASCHIIPGLVSAEVHVGPPLGAAGSRRYIAGVLRNTPENMVRWIMDPDEVDPLTTMPDLGVTLGEARHMAAYLYSMAPERSKAHEQKTSPRQSDGSGGSDRSDGERHLPEPTWGGPSARRE